MQFNDIYGMTAIEYSRRLYELIKEEKSAKRVLYILEHTKTGEITDEDIIEARGFYHGIKYAREMLRNVCCEYLTDYIEPNEENAENEITPEDGSYEEVEADNEMLYCPNNCPFIGICYTEECEFEIIEKEEEEDG